MEYSSSASSSSSPMLLNLQSSSPLLESSSLVPKPTKKSLVVGEAKTPPSPQPAASCREDSFHLTQLKSSERKALQQLKQKLILLKRESSTSLDIIEYTMWGIPLLGGEEEEEKEAAADVILLKFLRARDFKTDGIVEEDLGFKELEGVVAYMNGFDRQGHPVCYNAYGIFRDRDMYERIFGDDEKLEKFLRWRIQVPERGIKLLHFKPGGINSIIQVTDLKDMPKRDLRVASNHILSLFQDNYPEMVARKIFINVPWYFSILYSVFTPFLTQRTKSKFVISKEGSVAETLYKFIRPENVPVQYGGLSRPGDSENGPASEFTVKGGEKVNIQIEGIEAGATIRWDIVVGGWEVEYFAEFVPNAEDSYTIAVEKARKMVAVEEAVHNSYTSKHAGTLVLSVDNTTSRKRKVAAYRYIVQKSTT